MGAGKWSNQYNMPTIEARRPRSVQPLSTDTRDDNEAAQSG